MSHMLKIQFLETEKSLITLISETTIIDVNSPKIKNARGREREREN